MKTLKCKSIAPNVSLYVAGDLVGESEREVAVHLLACEDCRRLSEEFSESSSLLARACPPTEFGPDFYAGIRSAVLADIGRRRSRPSLFRPRWLYATAFAAIVIASGVMLLQFSSTRRPAAQSVALALSVKDQPTSDQAKETNLSPSAQSGERSRLFSVPVSRRIAPVRRSNASDNSKAARSNRTQIARAIKSPAKVEPVALESAPAPVASASQVSRIEIQTANPNIRIIWLTPQEPEASEDTNREQDQHKNGTR